TAKDFELYQNYPNPFNPSTVIGYQLPVSSDVTLTIYDVLGNEVVTLVNEYRPAGSYEVEFNTSELPSRSGSALTSGVYFYRLSAGNYSETKSMILLK
ncbi:MAG: T9SS type A sorting domain-containing protein, partial [Ignavibacteriaceae bacterium]|nr:T9SS type A sorting domain-containing protein [Ignavibacteriaceae bacterium]